MTQPADSGGLLGSTKIVGNKVEYTAPNFNSGPNETFNFTYTISKGYEYRHRHGEGHGASRDCPLKA